MTALATEIHDPRQGNRAERRAVERQRLKESRAFPEALVIIPRSDWPMARPPEGIVKAYRSRDFLVQVYDAPAPAVVRLSVNRIAMAGQRWADGISWEELQRLKAEAGYSEWDAVEVYPKESDVVNVANMRHLWILAEPLEFAWRAKSCL